MSNQTQFVNNYKTLIYIVYKTIGSDASSDNLQGLHLDILHVRVNMTTDGRPTSFSPIAEQMFLKSKNIYKQNRHES